MSRRGYVIFSIATGVLKGVVLVAVVFWLLPLWGISIPVWGIILLATAFVTYEGVTFRLGKRALERKITASPQSIIGCCGRATTSLAPDGYVQVNGELWRAFSNDMNVDEGDDIVVVEVNRLILGVAPLSGKVAGTSLQPDAQSD